MPYRSRRSRTLTVAAAWLLFACAVIGTGVAYLAYQLLCIENCERRGWEEAAGLASACLAVAPAAAMVVFATRGQPRRALWALGASIVLYAAALVLINAGALWG